jgi:hypothetical protein
MGQIKITTQVETIDSNGHKQTDSYVYSNTSLNELSKQEITVAASTTTIIWDPVNWTNYPITDFDFMTIVPTVDLDMELTCNEGDANEELFTIPLAKNLPVHFASNRSYYNHSASDAFAGTLDVIDKIRVQEGNGTAGKLFIILFT